MSENLAIIGASYLQLPLINKAKEMGYDFNIGPECEFFLFDTDENGNPTTITRERGGFLSYKYR